MRLSYPCLQSQLRGHLLPMKTPGRSKTTAREKSTERLIDSLPTDFQPPEGFRCVFTVMSSLPIASVNLYSVALDALVRISAQEWKEPAQSFSLQSVDFTSDVRIVVRPLRDSHGRIKGLNSYFEWALFRSVVALNNPTNHRALVAQISVQGQRVGEIDFSFRRNSLSRRISETSAKYANAALAKSASLIVRNQAKVLDKIASVPGIPFRVKWNTPIESKSLRRETVYDIAAYTILWTGRFPSDWYVDSLGQIRIPGIRTFFQVDPDQFEGETLVTVKMVAILVKYMVIQLEKNRKFCETYLELFDTNNQIVATIGLFGGSLRYNASSGSKNSTALLNASFSTATKDSPGTTTRSALDL